MRPVMAGGLHTKTPLTAVLRIGVAVRVMRLRPIKAVSFTPTNTDRDHGKPGFGGNFCISDRSKVPPPTVGARIANDAMN